MSFLFAPVCGNERPAAITVNGVDPSKKMEAMTHDTAPAQDNGEDAVADFAPIGSEPAEGSVDRGCMPSSPIVYMDNFRESITGHDAARKVLRPSLANAVGLFAAPNETG